MKKTMKKNDHSQIEHALIAAKDILSIKDTRNRYSTFGESGPSKRSPIMTNQWAAKNMLASTLNKPDAEADKFDEMLAQNKTELRQYVEKGKADALKRSSFAKDYLRYAIDGRRKTFEHLATLAPPAQAIQYELLDSPFLIWGTQGIKFPDTHVEPYNSWAKFILDSDKSGSEEMSFYFLWENPNDAFTVINVDAYLVLNGFCQTGSDGGFWPGDRWSSLTVESRLYLLEWWNQPPTQPLHQIDQFQQAVALSTSTGGFGDPGAIEFRDVFRGFDLRYNLFLLPPHGVAVFEVAANVSYSMSDGAIHVDFASGDFEVMCPAVLVSVLS